MRRFKSFLPILLALSLWLPIQEATALAMPLCRHTAEQALQVEVLQAQTAGHCHEAAVMVAEPTGNETDCDNCGMCHLAIAGFLPTTAISLTAAAASILVMLPALTPPSHIGEPPQQPPRRLN